MSELEWRHAIERGNKTGAAEIILTGTQRPLPLLSFYQSQKDLPKIECDLTIRLVGNVRCEGIGPLITIEGAAYQPYELTVTGGGRVFSDNTFNESIFLRSVDLTGATFKNVRLYGFGVAFEGACYRTWHERCRYRDIMLRRCGTGFRFIDRAHYASENGIVADVDPSVDQRVKGKSFMRTRIRDIDIGGCKDYRRKGILVRADGAGLADSRIHDIYGNVPNGGGTLIYLNTEWVPRTTIEHIHLEKANDSSRPASYIIGREDGSKVPSHREVYWLGGHAETFMPRTEGDQIDAKSLREALDRSH